MTTIRQLCDNDPAVAIEYMIDGLVNHKEIKRFRLDLDSPTKYKDGICTGGVATVTLVKILDMSFAAPQLGDEFNRADLMQTDRRDLLDFEEAIELFRGGNLCAMERYFELASSRTEKMPWNLQNSSWEQEIAEVINFWEQLTGRRYGQPAKCMSERWRSAASMAEKRLTVEVQRFGRVGGLKG